MKVILMERVEKLGQMGDVVTVKPGFARNFLLPREKALRATKTNLERFEKQRAQLEAHNLERRTEAEQLAAKMGDVSVILIRQASDAGQLYGSVNARDIAEAVTAEGFTVERRQIALDRPIKALGIHPVRVQLHPEVDVTVKANVARSQDEAEAQAAGRSIRADEQDEEDLIADAEEFFEDTALAPSEDDEAVEETAGEAVPEQAAAEDDTEAAEKP